jgi:hypothetical protein
MSQPRARKRDSAQSLDKQLRFAISRKRPIGLRYDGVLRIGEPHDYGIRRGTPRLLFYQLQRATGDHRWAAMVGWKELWLTKIEACTVSQETFPGSRESSHRKHLTWDKLFARVK